MLGDGGGVGGGGCGVSANEYSCALRAQKKIGDLTPYIIYGFTAAGFRFGISYQHMKGYKAGPFENIFWGGAVN